MENQEVVKSIVEYEAEIESLNAVARDAMAKLTVVHESLRKLRVESELPGIINHPIKFIFNQYAFDKFSDSEGILFKKTEKMIREYIDARVIPGKCYQTVFSSSYWPKTGMKAIRISLHLEDEDAVLESIVKFIDHMYEIGYPTVEDDGKQIIVIDVFESTLSRHGGYIVRYCPFDGTADLRTSYRTLSEGDLLTVLKYVRKYHWYEGGDESDED